MSREFYKITSSACIEQIIEYIKKDPSVIRTQVNFRFEDDSELMNEILWPALFDKKAWCRVSVQRRFPNSDEFQMGSDKEVWTFENDTWLDHKKDIQVSLTTELGNFEEILVKVRW